MIFPINVHRRAVNARKLVAQDKTAITVQLFVIANIGCFFLMKFLFGTFLGLGVGWAILAQLILFTAIGILIFRYIIFKEDEKIQEYNDEQTDSFARYLYVRKDNVTQLSCAEQAITAFEFTNGCLTTTMLFRFGSNNDAKAKSTYEVLNRMYGLISSYNFKFCTDTMPEVFTNSLEYHGTLYPFFCFLFAAAQIFGAEGNILGHSFLKELVLRILENHAYGMALGHCFLRLGCQIHAVNGHLAGGRMDEAVQVLDEGGFAAACMTDNTDKLSRLDGEADIFQRHLFKRRALAVHAAYIFDTYGHNASPSSSSVKQSSGT